MDNPIDLSRIDELLKAELTVPQLESLPNTIVSIQQPDSVSSEISALHRSIVTELNAYYLFNGEYQKLSKIKEQFSEELATLTPVGHKDLWKRVNATLKKRGLPEFQIQHRKVTLEFDPEFIGAVNTVADFTDKRPMASKLKEIGVSTRQWNNWLKSQKYYDYYHGVIDRLMDREVFEEGRLALAQNVSRGDLASFKYFNELTDKFVSQKEFDPRIIGVLMSGVLDIIMRHVEGTVAAKIAEEIQAMGIQSLSGINAIEAVSKPINLD